MEHNPIRTKQWSGGKGGLAVKAIGKVRICQRCKAHTCAVFPLDYKRKSTNPCCTSCGGTELKLRRVYVKDKHG